MLYKDNYIKGVKLGRGRGCKTFYFRNLWFYEYRPGDKMENTHKEYWCRFLSILDWVNRQINKFSDFFSILDK
jgi:hypothetical protein